VDSAPAFANASLPAGFAFNAGGNSAIGGGWAPGATSGLSMIWTGGATVLPANDVITLTNVTNPSAAGTYYLRVETYTSATCSSGIIDATTTGFVITANRVVQTRVLPTLTFVVTGRATGCNGQTGTMADNTGSSAELTMGRVTSTDVGAGAQDVAVSTNAAGGAVVYVRGDFASGNLRSTAHNFADSGPTAPRVGVESFGYTAASPHRGLAINEFATLTNIDAEIAYSSAGDIPPSCIGFQASATADTPNGVYGATVTYTAVPSF